LKHWQVQGFCDALSVVEGFACSSTRPSPAGCDESVSWAGGIGGSLAFIPMLIRSGLSAGLLLVQLKGLETADYTQHLASWGERLTL
jgi:hypothetical protein